MQKAVEEWRSRVHEESGHEYLRDSFEAMLGDLSASDDQSIRLIVETLISELNHAVNSFDRVEPYWESFQSQHEFEKLSDSWGEFVLQNRKMGGYEVSDSKIERHPKCSCGGPHYRFEFTLAEQWRLYAVQCLKCLIKLGELHDHFNTISESDIQQVKDALQTHEKHVGRGAFAAYFHPMIPEDLVKDLESTMGRTKP